MGLCQHQGECVSTRAVENRMVKLVHAAVAENEIETGCKKTRNKDERGKVDVEIRQYKREQIF